MAVLRHLNAHSTQTRCRRRGNVSGANGDKDLADKSPPLVAVAGRWKELIDRRFIGEGNLLRVDNVWGAAKFCNWH
jgi:hypothetical protein